MTPPKPHVSDKKKQDVKELVGLLKSYPIIGIVNVENLPSAQFQKIRNQLKGKAEIRMVKARLMRVAFDQVKDKVKGVEQLDPYLKGMPALILTKENPFKLYKQIMKSKSTAPAKPGQTAPNDLILTAGPTPFPPGPIISELGSQGLKTEIKEGKVCIKEDKVVVKEGEVVDENAAALLAKMGIEPMEICLNVVAVLENGAVIEKKVLAVDEKQYVANIKAMAGEAYSLAMQIGYATKENIAALLGKAHREASSLADSKGIMTSENVSKTLLKAESEMLALKAKVKEKPEEKEAAKEEKAEENKEEPQKEASEKPEEKKEDEPKNV